MNLGKEFVEKLGIDSGVDTFTRWMAHYIAEQMTKSEDALPDEKAIADKECFETILKLWSHRSVLPNGSRPYESFEPIFATLDKLDPTKKEPFFFRSEYGWDNYQTKNRPKETPPQVSHWINVASEVEYAARKSLKYTFSRAAEHARDAGTKKWLQNAVGLQDDYDSQIVQTLFENLADSEDGDDHNQIKERDLKALKVEVERLETANEILQEIILTHKQQIKELESEN